MYPIEYTKWIHWVLILFPSHSIGVWSKYRWRTGSGNSSLNHLWNWNLILTSLHSQLKRDECINLQSYLRLSEWDECDHSRNELTAQNVDTTSIDHIIFIPVRFSWCYQKAEIFYSSYQTEFICDLWIKWSLSREQIQWRIVSCHMAFLLDYSQFKSHLLQIDLLYYVP